MTNRTNRSLEFYNDYIDCTQNVPMGIQHCVTEIHKCDSQYQKMMSTIKELTNNFDDSMSKLYSEKLTELLIMGKNIGDKKVQTVQHISDLVEDKVRCLENSRKYLISNKQPDVTKPISSKEKPANSNCSKVRCIPSTGILSKELKKRNSNTDNDSNESNNDAKVAKRYRYNKSNEQDNKEISDNVALLALKHSKTPLPKATATSQVQSQATLKKTIQKTETKTKKKGKFKKQQKDNLPSADDDDEIDFDPDEPTYCLCDQISYGEMICCDNDLCPIEWFHFSCVSLSTKPKGKWFCPKCRGVRPNIMKPKPQFLKELEQYNKEKEDNA